MGHSTHQVELGWRRRDGQVTPSCKTEDVYFPDWWPGSADFLIYEQQGFDEERGATMTVSFFHVVAAALVLVHLCVGTELAHRALMADEETLIRDAFGKTDWRESLTASL